MEYSVKEKQAFVKKVVDEAKSRAKVDTGFLRRSIRGNWFKDIATFREVYYGAYNGNSDLINIAKRIMPKEIPWRVIFVDEDGRETKIEGETRTGRKVSRSFIDSFTQTTSKIKAFLNSLRDGKETDDRRKANKKNNDR